MQDSAVECIRTVYSSALDEEAHYPYSWLENYVERIEGEVARRECLDSYEYHAVMATLLA
jgi:hypothetical protein